MTPLSPITTKYSDCIYCIVSVLILLVVIKRSGMENKSFAEKSGN